MGTHPNDVELSTFVDRELSPLEAARIAKHVGHCHRCQVQVEELLNLGALLKAVPAPVMPAGFEDHLVAMVAAERAAVSVRRQPLSLPTLAAVGLVACLASAVVVLPLVGLGAQTLLLQLALGVKQLLMVGLQVLPVLKAIALLVQQIWFPLLTLCAVAAALPLVMASRAVNGRVRLGGAW